MQPDEVAVVAELLFLAGGRQIGWIEGRGAGHHRITPADQNLRLVPFGNVMRLVETVGDLLEGKGRRAGVLGHSSAAQQFVAKRGCGPHAEETAQRIAPAKPPLDQIANRRFGAGI